jgi:hypothetical protein
MPVHGTEFWDGHYTRDFGSSAPSFFRFFSFFILPLGTTVKYMLIYIYMYIHIGILFGWWKTCDVTPLSPRATNYSQLGPWGLG